MSLNRTTIRKLDPVSILRTRQLHPKLRMVASVLIEKLTMKGIPVFVTWTYRPFDVQDTLYNLGRTIPGPLYTTKRAGYSYHNYGLALDFCLMMKGQLVTWESANLQQLHKSYWLTTIELFEMAGWQSGFRTPLFEPQHLYYDFGKTTCELYDMYETSRKDEEGYLIFT